MTAQEATKALSGREFTHTIEKKSDGNWVLRRKTEKELKEFNRQFTRMYEAHLDSTIDRRGW